MPGEVAKILFAAAKTVAVYLILEILTAGLIAVAFSIPLVKLSLPFLLFLLPGVVVVPLILNARRYFNRPKTCALLFALALSIFCLLITIATVHSATWLGWWPHDVEKDVLFVAIFGCAFMAGTGYRLTYKRLTAQGS